MSANATGSAEPQGPRPQADAARPLSGRERIALAMRHNQPDRVPVMCQLSLGHHMLNSEIPPAEIWHSSEAFAHCLVRLQRKYGFDGILVNLPGRKPDWREDVEKIVETKDEQLLYWKGYPGLTKCPWNDNAHHYLPDPKRPGALVKDNDLSVRPELAAVDLDKIFYDDPHTNGGLKYPYYFDTIPYEPRYDDPDSYFPEHQYRTIQLVKEMAGDEVSVHGEFFAPFSQIMELLGYERALIGLLDDPDQMKAILDRYADGCIHYACELAAQGIDAILMSSAFAGGGFISREMYEEFVLPCENKVWSGIASRCPDLPSYVHTCGAIGDRLDLMMATGVWGIDTLDPPPLGTCDLEEAKAQVGDRMFFKGNIDSVTNLLQAQDEEARISDILWRLKHGMPGGGYILSTACSVAPQVRPERLMQLRELAETYGRYDGQGQEIPADVKPLNVR